MNFWQWLIDQGLISGPADWYTSGHSDVNYEHALNTAIGALGDKSPETKLAFWQNMVDVGAISGPADWYVSGHGDIDFEHAVNVASDWFKGSQGGGAIPATGAVGTPSGVLQGGTLIRRQHPEGDRYYQVYEFPPGSGQFMSFMYNDLKQVQAALGPNPDIQTRTEAWFQSNVMVEATAEEVIGKPGSFQVLTNDMMREAAIKAGVNDPTLIGKIAGDPEMQQIMASAIVGDWTPEQVRAAQRNTSFWKDTLYPGIERFYGSTSDPEGAWAEYRASVSPALEALGYTRGPDGTFNVEVERMLDANISSDIFMSQVPTFIQATQNAEYAGVLNQWAESELGRSVEFNDWFDLLAGESMPELEDVAEKASLAYQAQTRGADITDDMVRELASRTQMSEAQMQATFTEFNEAILALGEMGLQRGGLTRDEVLAAAAGVTSLSGRNVDEVKLQVAKLARENALFDDEKINFYVGFDPMGRPMRPGLQGLTPEGA